MQQLKEFKQFQFRCFPSEPGKSIALRAPSLHCAIAEFEQKHSIPSSGWTETPDPNTRQIATHINGWKLFQSEVKLSYWNTHGSNYCPKKEAEKKEADWRNKRQARFAILRRKYQNVNLHRACMLLFWRECRLTVSDISEILQVPESDVSWELDKALQNAR